MVKTKVREWIVQVQFSNRRYDLIKTDATKLGISVFESETDAVAFKERIAPQYPQFKFRATCQWRQAVYL